MQPGDTPAGWTTSTSGKLRWIDIQDPTQQDVSLLAQRYPFHPLNLEDCLSTRQLTHVEDHESYIFLLTHFPSVDEGGLVVRNQLTVFVGEGYVVSLHGSGLNAVREMAQNFGKGGAKDSKSPAHLVYSIVDLLVDGMFPILDRLGGELDGLEESVFSGGQGVAGKINSLRRRIAALRRTVVPLRNTMAEASSLLQRFGTRELLVYFKDVLDHIDRVSETLEESTETIEIYKDTNFITTSDRTNQVLSVLTIIFTLTLPAAIIAAVYGMNVALPLGNGQNPPEFLGPFTSFILLVVAMLIPTGLMAWYFRRRGWF